MWVLEELLKVFPDQSLVLTNWHLESPEKTWKKSKAKQTALHQCWGKGWSGKWWVSKSILTQPCCHLTLVLAVERTAPAQWRQQQSLYLNVPIWKSALRTNLCWVHKPFWSRWTPAWGQCDASVWGSACTNTLPWGFTASVRTTLGSQT